MTSAVPQFTNLGNTEEIMRLAVEASPNGIVMTDRNGSIIMVNVATEKLFGYTRQELIGQPVEMLIPVSHRAHHPELRNNYTKNPSRRAMGHGRDLHGLHKSGKEFSVEVGLNSIQTPNGIVVLASVIDISERKQQEEQLKSALTEKELLLAEIHHRVKNNLQIIDSLLSMQSDNLPNSITVDALQECQNRVKSMALIHQTLYESRDFSRVNFSNFTQTLIDNLLISYMSDTSKVAITIQADSIHLPIDTSIPLGLILNELCTNALKYAFPGNRDGKIAITMKLQTSGHVLVQVSDTGIGIPDDLDIENTSSLGLQLVQLLSEQIAAKLTIQRKNPTSFTLLIPVPK
jgi:PAS domain S-box-containing protein